MEGKITYLPPFDDADADLILRSSDNAFFRVFRGILKKASTVFADMFSLPSGSVSERETPIIDLAEDKLLLFNLLQACHPMGGPLLNSLDELGPLLVVCDKYQMDGVMRSLGERYLCRQLLDGCKDPLRIYALAILAKMPDVAEQAAIRCLSKPLSYLITANLPEFRFISLASYRCLLEFSHAYREAAAAVVSSYCYPWATGYPCWFRCMACPAASDGTFFVKWGQINYYVRRWWVDFMDALARSLRDQPEPLSRIAAPAEAGLPAVIPCQNCHNCYAEMVPFLTQLRQEVEKAVSSVKFVLVA